MKPVRTGQTGKRCQAGKCILVPALILALVPGCTTMRAVPLEPTKIGETIKAGDQVRVITRDGQEMEFVVKQITQERLEGEKEQVAFSNLGLVEKREFSPGKSAALAAGVAVSLILALLIAALVSGPYVGPLYAK